MTAQIARLTALAVTQARTLSPARRPSSTGTGAAGSAGRSAVTHASSRAGRIHRAQTLVVLLQVEPPLPLGPAEQVGDALPVGVACPLVVTVRGRVHRPIRAAPPGPPGDLVAVSAAPP